MHTIFTQPAQTPTLEMGGLQDFLQDTMQDWCDIRVTEMAGFDYLFVPMDICDQITDFVTLQEFLTNAQALLGSEPQRTILIGFKEEAGQTLMDRYDVEWAEDLVIDCRRTTVTGTSQQEFIELLLEHSEFLVAA